MRNFFFFSPLSPKKLRYPEKNVRKFGEKSQPASKVGRSVAFPTANQMQRRKIFIARNAVTISGRRFRGNTFATRIDNVPLPGNRDRRTKKKKKKEKEIIERNLIPFSLSVYPEIVVGIS